MISYDSQVINCLRMVDCAIIIDINECADGTHRCSQACRNNIGSYTCLCNQGYLLTSDNRTCRG